MRYYLAVAILTLLAGCNAQQEIISNLSETDANQLLVVLDSQKISATKVAGTGRTVTYSITVKASQASQALRILVDNRLPLQPSSGLADVYPPGGGGLIPTSSEEKAKFLMAIQGEIENMLKTLPGFVTARVAIVLPDTNIIREVSGGPPQATASVAIVYNPINDAGDSSITPDDVKYLVSSAVEGLTPAGVTVVMASNVPMRLVDTGNNVVSKKKTAPAQAAQPPQTPTMSRPSQPAGPPSASTEMPLEGPSLAQNPPTTPSVLGKVGANTVLPTAQNTQDKNRTLLFLLAALAIIGLVLGTFGLIRSISLRSKLARMEQGLIPKEEAASETPALAAGAKEAGPSGEVGSSA